MKILVLLAFVCLSFPLRAVEALFSRLATESGLSSAQVTSILQDRKGYLWVGTADGLNRYDGETFEVFLPATDDEHSLQSSYIDQLFEDATGAIWLFLASGEISCYQPDSGRFTNYTREWLQQQLRVYGRPTCFSAAVPGRALIGTENGLLMFDYASRKLTRIPATSSVVATSLINCLSTTQDGSFWVGTLSGYSLYLPATNEFTDYTLQTSTHQDSGHLNGIHAIYKDSSGNLWLGTGNRGAFCAPATNGQRLFYPVGDARAHVYQFLETRTGHIWIGHSRGATLVRAHNRESLRSEAFFNTPEDLAPTGECHVRTLMEDKNGIVWFGDSRFNQGLCYYDPQTDRTDLLRNSTENPYSIGSNQITCLYMDRSDNLWIGHANYGLSRCDLSAPVFNYIFGYRTEGSGLSSNHVVALCEDSRSNLWIGTTKGLDRLNHQTGRIDRHYHFSPAGGQASLSGRRIGSLQEDAKQTLWISYLDANPDRLHLDSEEKHPFRPDHRTAYEPVLKSLAKLCIEPTGSVWFTTVHAGLIKYDPSRNKPSFYTQPPLLPTGRSSSYQELSSICITPDRKVWIGTDGEGLRCLDEVTETFTNYRHRSGSPGSLASNHIRYLFSDAAGRLWVGTNAGLDRLDASTGLFTHYTTHDGLAGNIIQGVQEAEPGILFISTNRGISRLDTHNGQIINYSTTNGLLSNEFIAGACCKRRSGEIVFGSNRGIVSFNPARIQEGYRKMAHSPLITEVSVDAVKLPPANALLLPYADLKDLKIQFLSFNYAHPQNNRYRYKLRPYDADWKETDSYHRYVLYNQLSPGSYTLLVEASEDGIVWSEPTTLDIRVLPPWWRTGWFLSGVSLLVAALLYMAYKSRIHWYQVRQAELEQKVHDRTLLLKQANNKLQELDEQKTRFFTNVSHELRTPLTIINGLTENLEQDPALQNDEAGKESLHTIRQNTHRLIRQVNELLNSSVVEQGLREPVLSLTDMNRFLQELASTFGPVAQREQIRFSYTIAPELGPSCFDKDIVEQILYNLLSNAFKYTPDGGQVEFRASLGEGGVILSVQDTGIGIPEESLPHIFDRYYQDAHKTFQRSDSSGIGLAYTRELVKRHQGSIVCQSKVGVGTLFTCSIPLPETVPQPPTSGNENKPALLFIEDNDDLRRYLSDAFRPDYQVLLAMNGEEGYRLAAEKQPAAIVSDVMMPVMNGIQCCEKLKTDERTAHIPVILLTALAEERQQLEGYGAGADDYLPKPFSIHILKAKIRNLIARKEQLQSYFKDTFNLYTPDDSLPDREKDFVAKATRIVLDNLQNPQFDSEQFCTEMAMSRANLFRKLKATTGSSASAFTRNIRMKRAAELLGQHAYTINEVSSLVGFSDPNYFSRCFKEVYGVTPSNY